MTVAGGYDLVILDLDGVVYLGTQPIPGAPAAIAALGVGGPAIAYVTNNASRSAAAVAELLQSLGLPATVDQVVTSAQAAAELLARELSADSPVLVVGAPALRDEVRRAGLRPVDEAGQRPVAVVQGYGPRVGWPELAEACVAIRGGARWVATNIDATLPSPRGPLPGNGSLVAALRSALGGRGPEVVVGKPEPELFRVTAQRSRAHRPLVVGDRLDTDIEGAVRAGMASLLVLTGVSTPADVLAAPPTRRPTYVAADLSALSREDVDVRIPQWRDEAAAGNWRVTFAGDRLVLHGGPTAGAGDAVPALAAAAWARPGWAGIDADGEPARAVLRALRLDQLDGRTLRSAFAS